MDGLTKGKVTIAFSRLRGGTDLQIAIDTFVEDTSPDDQRKRSPNAVLEFSNCVEQLVKNSQQRLEARP